jgi:hypothetical protein
LEAEQLYRAALPNWERLFGQDHYATRNLGKEFASLLHQEGKDTEAERILK